jgi:hypothetical protein
MKTLSLAIATILSVSVSGTAFADQWAPTGTLSFVVPTGVVGPNDTIVGQMTFTLDSSSPAIDLTTPFSNDMPGPDWTSVTSYGFSVGFGCSDTFTGGCKFTGGTPYNFNFDTSDAGYSKIQNNTLVLNPGDSVTFNAFIFTPNGTPVPAGTYFANYYNISGNISGTRSQQEFDSSGNAILDASGNPIFDQVSASYTFTVAESCTDWSGTSCAANQLFSRTVLAVPEPETYAMLLAGLGLMGMVARRRQNK